MLTHWSYVFLALTHRYKLVTPLISCDHWHDLPGWLIEHVYRFCHSLKTEQKCSYSDKIFITGCTESCHSDNFWCSLWWKFCQNDISISVNVLEYWSGFINNVIKNIYRASSHFSGPSRWVELWIILSTHEWEGRQVPRWRASITGLPFTWTHRLSGGKSLFLKIIFCNITQQPQRLSGPWFNIKMSSYQYRKSHCGDKTVVRSSYLHNGISCTGKMSSLYWIRALVLCSGAAS